MGQPERKERIILDTNVMVGAMVATLAPGDAHPYQHLDGTIFNFARQHMEICFSERTMTELRNVIVDTKGKTSDLGPTKLFHRLQFVDLLQREIRKPYRPGKTDVRCRDKFDQMFLDLAAGTCTRYIVSRDQDLLSLNQVGSCTILNPHQFKEAVMRPYWREEKKRTGFRSWRVNQRPSDPFAELAGRIAEGQSIPNNSTSQPSISFTPNIQNRHS